MTNIKKSVCLKCGSEKSLLMVYGLFESKKVGADIEKGVYYAGGAVTKSSPKWHCRECGLEWEKYEE